MIDVEFIEVQLVAAVVEPFHDWRSSRFLFQSAFEGQRLFPTPLCKHSISEVLMNSLKLFAWCPIIRDAFCELPRVRPESTPLPPSNPRMNSPRKSSVPEVPSVFFTPFAVPSAALHPVGQDEPKNAMTPPVGTVFEFKSFRFATIKFHAEALSGSFALTGERGEKAA